jgi:hypothetical protein
VKQPPIDKEPNYEDIIERPGLSIRIGPLAWWVEPRPDFKAGALADGSLIIVWRDGDHIHIYRHKEKP